VKVGWAQAVEALTDQYQVFTTVVMSLAPAELLAPSGCREWSNAALVFHMLTDAQRALVTFSSPAAGPADTDFIDYWKGFQSSDEGSKAGARYVRLSAAAHPDPRKISSRWQETAKAAVRRAKETAEIDFVTTQGHILATPDFIATLVVEATVHHLDLTASLSDKPAPASTAVSVTTRTLDGLLRVPRPQSWDDLTYILKATGRSDLNQSDESALREAAADFPLFS
jgi:hypothetical protein